MDVTLAQILATLTDLSVSVQNLQRENAELRQQLAAIQNLVILNEKPDNNSPKTE